MAWKQILYPNLDDDPNNPLYIWIGGQIISDWCGWCLAVVAGAYGASGSSYSAKTAWQACGTKHYDRNIPEGIYVPLWYEGGEYGHVVFGLRTGNSLTIWTSPCGVHMGTFQVYSGEVNWLLDYIGQIFGVGAFSGWSESVLDSRVIGVVTETKPEPTPEPEPEPTPTPDPEPEPEPEPEPNPDPIENNNGKDDNMENPEPNHETQQLVGGIIEQAGEGWFEPSNKCKLIAYLVGDFLLVAGLLVPSIISMINAQTPQMFGEYLAKTLLEAGTCILMIFKLIKKK